MQIELEKLYPDFRNSNICPPKVMDKIKRNIQRTGQCPPLIVRPHPQHAEAYILIDGHHRLLILKELGWTVVECQVWNVNEQEAAIALATLNRLRGSDDIHKRAELLDSLTQTLPITDLSLLLPETESEIEDMLALLRLDELALEEAIQKQIESEKAIIPVPYAFMVSATDAQVIDRALELYPGEKSQQFLTLCQKHLEILSHHG